MKEDEDDEIVNTDAVKKAIRAAHADNVECVPLSSGLSSAVYQCLWEALAEVQDQFLPYMCDAARAYLRKKITKPICRQLRLFE